jgi:hypothetical protein
MSSFQSSGFSSMNMLISFWQSWLCNTMTSTPFCFRYSSPPTKVLFSPDVISNIRELLCGKHTNHDPLDLVHDTGSSAHITRRQCRVHGRATIDISREPARVLQRGYLSLRLLTSGHASIRHHSAQPTCRVALLFWMRML